MYASARTGAFSYPARPAQKWHCMQRHQRGVCELRYNTTDILVLCVFAALN